MAKLGRPLAGLAAALVIGIAAPAVSAEALHVSDAKIAWRDANDGWRYTLDLKSGDLTVVLASSVGGNMYFHRCLLDH